MARRQNKASYDLRKIWQANTSFGNIVCNAEKKINLKGLSALQFSYLFIDENGLKI